MQEDRINPCRQHLLCAGGKKSRQSLRILLMAALLCCLISIVFFPSLKNGFNWDDDVYIKNNSLITYFSWENIKSIFTGSCIANYPPLTMLSFLFEYHFFQLNPFGYHICSLFLHLCNCLLVFWLIVALGGRRAVACVTSFLFGIHPLRVEAVAWISASKDLLFTAFFLGAMICYVYYARENRRKIYYYFSFALFICSLLSKLMAVSFPFMLLWLDYLLERKKSNAVWLEKTPFFFASLVFGSIGAISHYSGRGGYDGGDFHVLNVLTDSGYIIIHYLKKIALPQKLVCFYPWPQQPEKIWSFVIFLCLIPALFLIWKKGVRRIMFGAGFFLTALLPAMHFIPVGQVLVADRYVYLASVGISYIIAEALSWVYVQKIGCSLRARRFFIVIMSGMAILLSVTSWKQCALWKDGVRLWSAVIKYYPRHITAYNNRGMLLYQEGAFKEAYGDFQSAISLATDYREISFPSYNLGNLFFDMGKPQDAIATFKRLLERNPNDAEAYFNLGKIYDNTSRDDEAAVCYKKTIALSPSYTLAYYNLGCLYAKEDKTQEAVDMFNKTIETKPDYFPAYVWLAYFYKTAGNTQALTSLYQRAVKQNVQYFEAFYFMASLYSAQGREKEALKLYKKAVSINPDSLEAHVRLGTLYFLSGDVSKALRYYNKALALNPAQGVIHNNLAAAYYYKGKHKEALKHCKQALALGYHIAPQLFEKLPQCKE